MTLFILNCSFDWAQVYNWGRQGVGVWCRSLRSLTPRCEEIIQIGPKA